MALTDNITVLMDEGTRGAIRIAPDRHLISAYDSYFRRCGARVFDIALPWLYFIWRSDHRWLLCSTQPTDIDGPLYHTVLSNLKPDGQLCFHGRFDSPVVITDYQEALKWFDGFMSSTFHNGWYYAWDQYNLLPAAFQKYTDGNGERFLDMLAYLESISVDKVLQLDYTPVHKSIRELLSPSYTPPKHW